MSEEGRKEGNEEEGGEEGRKKGEQREEWEDEDGRDSGMGKKGQEAEGLRGDAPGPFLPHDLLGTGKDTNAGVRRASV